MMILLMIPGVQHIAAIAMPVFVGGLMIGCQQISDKSPMKFEYLFSGFKDNGKELIIMSLVYLLGVFVVVLATSSIMSISGIDLTNIVPANLQQMTETEQQQWINSLSKENLLNVLLAILIFMALMIPLFMAYWFAPALITLKKVSPLTAMKLSFLACKDNFFPFLIYGLSFFVYMMLFFIHMSVVTLIAPPLSIILLLAGIITATAVSLATIFTSYTDIFEQAKQSSTNDNIDSGSNNSDSSMIA